MKNLLQKKMKCEKLKLFRAASDTGHAEVRQLHHLTNNRKLFGRGDSRESRIRAPTLGLDRTELTLIRLQGRIRPVAVAITRVSCFRVSTKSPHDQFRHSFQ